MWFQDLRFLSTYTRNSKRCDWPLIKIRCSEVRIEIFRSFFGRIGDGSLWEHHQLLSRFFDFYVRGDQMMTIFAYFLYLYIDLNNLGWVILFWICAYVIYGWSISQMNSNGCVQALIDLNRVRTSLQPFLSIASKQFLKEATNSILDLQEANNF